MFPAPTFVYDSVLETSTPKESFWLISPWREPSTSHKVLLYALEKLDTDLHLGYCYYKDKHRRTIVFSGIDIKETKREISFF